MSERSCDYCNNWTPTKDLIDYGYRIGNTEVVVERWVCEKCDKEIYDEAMSQIGDYY